MLACTTGYIDIVKLLLVNPNIDINQEDSAGINAIYVCAYYGQLEILKLLKEHGGLFKPSHKGTTILHVACKKGFFEIVKYILHDCKDQRIPIDCPKGNGMTPLMLAVRHDHLFILRILKDAGADLYRTNDQPGAGKANLLYYAA
jgi:ankyrin repeat protein